MADDADNQDVESSGADITPEDFDGKQEESPKTDSSPDKNSEAEKAKSEEPAKPAEQPEESDDSDEGKEGEESEDKGKESEEPEADKPKSNAETRKAELNSEIRDLVAKRNELRREAKEANDEVYQAKTAEELVEEGMDPTDAKIEAMRQEGALRDYNEQVAEAQLTLESESDRVLRDFAWADPQNENFDKDLAEQAAELLQSNLIVDQNTGQIVGSNISPYQLYKTLDGARATTAAKSQIEGQKAAEKMMASTDEGPTTAPSKKSDDPLKALWAEEL